MVNLIKEYEKKIVAKSPASRVATVSFTEDAVILQFVKTFRAQRKKKITISQKRILSDNPNPTSVRRPKKKRSRKNERPDLEPPAPTAESNESDEYNEYNESDESDESEEADGGLNKQRLKLQELRVNFEPDGMSRDSNDNIEEIDSKTSPAEDQDNFAKATKVVAGWLGSAHESNSKPPLEYGTSAEVGKVFDGKDTDKEITAIVILTNRLKAHAGPAGKAMPGQRLTHVVDFACVYGDAVATLVNKIGWTDGHFKRGHDPRTLRFFKTLPLSKRLWVALFQKLFPETEKLGEYVAYEWKRGWIAVYNIISQFPCLKPLRKVPLTGFHAVAKTLLTIVEYVDNLNKVEGKSAPTNDDMKSALGIC